MRDRLIEAIKNSLNKHIGKSCWLAENITNDLIADGWMRPPCRVGDKVWDTEGNAWEVFAITIWQDCIGLKTANNRDIRKTFTIGKHSIGKTVFLTKEEAEKALKGGGDK